MEGPYQEYAWVLPVAVLAVVVIASTCCVFRKDILGFIKNTFYPTPKRYAIPSGILSRVTGTMPPYKDPEVNIDDPSKIIEEPLKVMKEGVMPVEKPVEEAKPKPEPEPQPEAKPELPPVVEEPKQEAPPKPEVQPEGPSRTPDNTKTNNSKIPELQKMDNPFVHTVKWFKSINYKKPVITDRTLLIIAILALLGINFYLGAKIKLLYSIQHRQFIVMKQMQDQIDLLKFGGKKPVIVYKIPANTR